MVCELSQVVIRSSLQKVVMHEWGVSVIVGSALYIFCTRTSGFRTPYLLVWHQITKAPPFGASNASKLSALRRPPSPRYWLRNAPIYDLDS